MPSEDYFWGIQRDGGGVILASDVIVSDNSLLTYTTPSGRKGYLNPTEWERVAEYPIGFVEDIYQNGKLCRPAEKELEEWYDE